VEREVAKLVTRNAQVSQITAGIEVERQNAQTEQGRR
jgi:hypothetical protein